LRQEFRTLYLEELSLGVASRLGQFLVVFGCNEEIQAMGHQIVKIMQDPLTQGGVDMFPVLKEMSDLGRPRIFTRTNRTSRALLWDIEDLILTLAASVYTLTTSMMSVSSNITAITIFKDSDQHHSEQADKPELRIDLDNEGASHLSQEEKKIEMKTVVEHSRLFRLEGIIITFHWGDRSYRWYVAGLEWDNTTPKMRLLSEEAR